MPHPLHVPDRSVVADLRRIDRDLSVDWVEPPGRWGVFHALQVDGNFEDSVDQLARQLQWTAAQHGYAWSHEDCALTAVNAVKARKLVCYVVNEDGSYRALDSRIVKKLKRLDWQRQNLDIKDWTILMNARADALRTARQLTEGDVWQTIRSDRVFGRMVSDILWGMRPVRSVIIPEGVPYAHADERDESPAAGASSGAQALGDRCNGVRVAVADPRDPPAGSVSGQ